MKNFVLTRAMGDEDLEAYFIGKRVRGQEWNER